MEKRRSSRLLGASQKRDVDGRLKDFADLSFMLFLKKANTINSLT